MQRRCQPATGEWKRQRGGEKGRRDRGRERTVWTLLARFPCPLQCLDPTSHVIRGSVNQQLGAQMKKCQLLPGAQRADRPCHGAFMPVYHPTHAYRGAHVHTSCHMGLHSQFNWAVPDWFWQDDGTELHGSIRHAVVVYSTDDNCSLWNSLSLRGSKREGNQKKSRSAGAAGRHKWKLHMTIIWRKSRYSKGNVLSLCLQRTNAWLR